MSREIEILHFVQNDILGSFSYYDTASGGEGISCIPLHPGEVGPIYRPGEGIASIKLLFY